MGLRRALDISDYGFMDSTPIMGVFIDYSAGWDTFAATFEEVATQLVPIDTGRLCDSIYAIPSGDGCECYADTEYAQYVEFGTYKMDAQPYFIPALEAAEAAAFPDWQDAVESALEEEQDLLEELEREEHEGGNRYKANEEMRNAITGGGGLGSFAGMVLGAVIVAVVNLFLDIFMYHGPDGDSSSSSSRGSGGGDGGVGGSGIAAQDVEIY